MKPSKIKLLRLVNSNKSTSAPYNQFTLPRIKKEETTILSFEKSKFKSSKQVKILSANGGILKFIFILYKLLTNNKFHILHAHTPHTVFCYFLVYSFISSSQRPNSRLTIHCSFENLKLKNKIILFLGCTIIDKIVFCSETSKSSFPVYWLKFFNNKCNVICNGVDIERVQNKISKIKINQKSKLFDIITVGRLIDIKNIDKIINLMSKIDNAKLTIIGDGYLKNKLLTQVKSLKLKERVFLIGEVGRDEVYKNLYLSDLFISLSSTEGLPIAVLESMICKCPVILSDIPSHLEIKDNCKSVIIVKTNNYKGIIRKINYLKNLNHQERDTIGMKCAEEVSENYNLDKMYNGYDNL